MKRVAQLLSVFFLNAAQTEAALIFTVYETPTGVSIHSTGSIHTNAFAFITSGPSAGSSYSAFDFSPSFAVIGDRRTSSTESLISQFASSSGTADLHPFAGPVGSAVDIPTTASLGKGVSISFGWNNFPNGGNPGDGFGSMAVQEGQRGELFWGDHTSANDVTIYDLPGEDLDSILLSKYDIGDSLTTTFRTGGFSDTVTFNITNGPPPVIPEPNITSLVAMSLGLLSLRRRRALIRPERSN